MKEQHEMTNRSNEPTQDTARRVYGVLATSLNEALVETRQALEPHAGLLAKGRIADLDALLAEFARRRVRLAIYGEVKAGKSTLLNALANKELSPAAFEPLTSVPVRVTYGSRTIWQVGSHRLDSLAELTQIMRTGVRDAAEVLVETDADLLQLGGQVDLLDTPGVGSDARFDAISAEALRSLDAVVLVVRYPALFTQVTRRLMEGLRADIGKLFVVWNLDADCAELSAAERAQHAERLRDDVAGAHELYLVDARAAFRAGQAGDRAAIASSGLPDLTAALSRFASSDKREVASLREAAKRAQKWIDEAHGQLALRRAALEAKLTETRERLQKVQSAAESKASAARGQFSEFQNAAAAAGQRFEATLSGHADTLLKQLRAARRAWVRSGQASQLDAAVGAAAESYAAACDEAGRAAAGELQAAAKKYGTVVPASAPTRRALRPESLAPPDRLERALTGSARSLRRAMWKRWYLPGLATLERSGVSGDVATQRAWLENAAKQAEAAVRGVLDGRLAEIARNAQAESERIRVETNFLAEEAEHQAVMAHLPVLAHSRERIEEIGKEARALMA
jgi:hypothetical protein